MKKILIFTMILLTLSLISCKSTTPVVEEEKVDEVIKESSLPLDTSVVEKEEEPEEEIDPDNPWGAPDESKPLDDFLPSDFIEGGQIIELPIIPIN